MSRVTAVMNGVTMIARMMPAASMRVPADCPPNRPPDDREVRQARVQRPA